MKQTVSMAERMLDQIERMGFGYSIDFMRHDYDDPNSGVFFYAFLHFARGTEGCYCTKSYDTREDAIHDIFHKASEIAIENAGKVEVAQDE